MKKIARISILIIMLTCLLPTLVGCSQIGAKSFGGSYTIELQQGEKLMNVTWKDNELWYLTKTMTDSDVAETYKFKEDSTFGVLEGTVTIKESK